MFGLTNVITQLNFSINQILNKQYYYKIKAMIKTKHILKLHNQMIVIVGNMYN